MQVNIDGIELRNGGSHEAVLSQGWSLASLRRAVQSGCSIRFKYADPMDLRLFPPKSDVMSDKELCSETCMDGLVTDIDCPLVIVVL